MSMRPPDHVVLCHPMRRKRQVPSLFLQPMRKRLRPSRREATGSSCPACVRRSGPSRHVVNNKNRHLTSCVLDPDPHRSGSVWLFWSLADTDLGESNISHEQNEMHEIHVLFELSRFCHRVCNLALNSGL